MTEKVVAKFNEWIKYLYQSNKPPVPEYALEIVRAQLSKRYGATATADINVTKIARALREINFEEYYGKEDQIQEALDSKAIPEISPKCQEKMKQLLVAMQPSYIKHSRQSHISFNYVMYKICQQFEQKAILPFIKLQISSDKLYRYDRVWHLICDDMKWFFIRSDPTLCSKTPVSTPLMISLTGNDVLVDRDMEEWTPEEVLKLQKGLEKKLSLEQLAVGHNRSLKNIEAQLKVLVINYHESKEHNLEGIKLLTGLAEDVIVDVISRHETRKSRQLTGVSSKQAVAAVPAVGAVPAQGQSQQETIIEILKDIQTMMRYLVSKHG
jgi:hypothetical protein